MHDVQDRHSCKQSPLKPDLQSYGIALVIERLWVELRCHTHSSLAGWLLQQLLQQSPQPRAAAVCYQSSLEAVHTLDGGLEWATTGPRHSKARQTSAYASCSCRCVVGVASRFWNCSGTASACSALTCHSQWPEPRLRKQTPGQPTACTDPRLLMP